MQADRIQPRLIQRTLDRAGRLAAGQGEAELLVEHPGADRLVPVNVDIGNYPDQHALATSHPGGQQRDLARRVDHDAPYSGGYRVVEFTGGFRVAVQDDPCRCHFAGQGDGKFAARADLHAGAFSRGPLGHRSAQQCLRGVDEFDAGKRGPKGADAGPEVFLVDHVAGRTELRGDLGEGHTADAQPARLVGMGGQRPNRRIEVWVRPLPHRRQHLGQSHTSKMRAESDLRLVLNEAFTRR